MSGQTEEADLPGAPWRIFVDTGGTFTDCLAVDPEGGEHRAKVLSSSALRGRVRRWLGDGRVQIGASWQVPGDFFAGFLFAPLAGGEAVRVAGYEPGEGVLHLGAPAPDWGEVLTEGAGFELRSPEEAPVLAARLVTGTPPGRPLPPLALRLATTRGTNALLERQGARTALFITRGFADLLEIGTQQRPDLFALAIEKPAPLYERVVEVPERLAADGSVLLPLDLEALAEPVAQLLAEGFESAAVALLHSYRNPEHEEAVATFLAGAGWTRISCSQRLSPRIQLLPRAQTAVVDAYLAPIIERYLGRVQEALPAQGSTLHVMTSAGGLVGVGEYRAKDSLLSGPAGGVVGAARAGRRSGYERIIAFDMGGTSTDVARFDGDFEYTVEHRVGGAHLLAPALAIESVAAGGGSLCWFDGDRLRVGPRSAGAVPGPACYGAGGPLTLTDVNLLLGRLEAGRFEIPIQREAAAQALAELATRTGAAEEALLEGALAIADELMADAIRTISVRRGYDPADYALVAFGGAGAQHACSVAELLEMKTVLVPADAALLSAAGLAAAVVERFAESQVLEPLETVGERIESRLEELGRQALERLAAEGVPEDRRHLRRCTARLRFAGQDSALEVEVPAGEAATKERLAAAFDQAHQELYGYRPEGRAIEVESLRVVASEPLIGTKPAPAPDPEAPAPPTGHRHAHFAGRWQEVPTFDRAALPPGAPFHGPALVFERHSATVVLPGWRGVLDGAGCLQLSRCPPAIEMAGYPTSPLRSEEGVLRPVRDDVG